MMEHIRESKWLNILMSVLLAVLFWLYVRAELDPSQTSWFYHVPVEITGSTVGTKDKTGSIITARSGFVGGVAGSNSGSISTSGGLDTQPLVKQINAWLDVPYKDETTTDENGNEVTAQVVDTDKQNANLNQMVRVLTGKASGDAEKKLQTDFKA